MNTNLKGSQTESKVLTAALERGIGVSIPFGDKDRYDQIWDVNGKLYRIQVKTCRFREDKSGAVTFNCYSTVNGKHKRYTKEEIDFFATIWNNKCYLIPITECSTEKTLWLSQEKPYPNCSLLSDYDLDKILIQL